jgi:hypothetical protein
MSVGMSILKIYSLREKGLRKMVRVGGLSVRNSAGMRSGDKEGVFRI